MPDILRSVRLSALSGDARQATWRPSALLFLGAAVLGLVLAAWLASMPQAAASETEADMTLVFPRD